MPFKAGAAQFSYIINPGQLSACIQAGVGGETSGENVRRLFNKEIEMSETPISFTETHHALLFAWIARAIIELAGIEKGEPAIRRAVALYGRQRGGRMALRAAANGDALSMANYMAYGEWQSSPGAMEQELLEKAPDARLRITRCPWQRAWQASGLLAYGRLYCLEIDDALAEGFNPTLKIDRLSLQTAGDPWCEFIYRGAGLPEQGVQFQPHAQPAYPAEKIKLSWEYHTGHLFAALETVLVAELGDIGRAAAAAGLAEFGSRFGEPAVQTILAYRNTDFSRPPDPA